MGSITGCLEPDSVGLRRVGKGARAGCSGGTEHMVRNFFLPCVFTRYISVEEFLRGALRW